LSEKILTMGKRFNSSFGCFELPSEIIEVGIFDDLIEFKCMDGIYRVKKELDSLLIQKCYEKECDH